MIETLFDALKFNFVFKGRLTMYSETGKSCLDGGKRKELISLSTFLLRGLHLAKYFLQLFQVLACNRNKNLSE